MSPNHPALFFFFVGDIIPLVYYLFLGVGGGHWNTLDRCFLLNCILACVTRARSHHPLRGGLCSFTMKMCEVFVRANCVCKSVGRFPVLATTPSCSRRWFFRSGVVRVRLTYLPWRAHLARMTLNPQYLWHIPSGVTQGGAELGAQ